MSAITHKAALFGIVETVSGTDEFGGAATDTRAILARDIDIVRAGGFERQADELASPLDCGPVVEFIGHALGSLISCRAPCMSAASRQRFNPLTVLSENFGAWGSPRP